MLFLSTKQQGPALPASAAILTGAAPDGGLYIPQAFPQFLPEDFGDPVELAGIATVLLLPFFEGDALAAELAEICAQVFTFPAPLIALSGRHHALELFHGPTGAFKDFGARFLAAAMDRLASPAEPLTVLVATSGDTGGAVGCAFASASIAKVVILYPKGRVSPFQEDQLTCWPTKTVTSLRVAGDFDDCQRLVKGAFADPVLKKNNGLSSANSINIGRLLPQMVYYAVSSLQLFRQTGAKASFIIPTGNLGNGVAALWARACGLPIGEIVFAQNANRALVDYFDTGKFTPAPSLATLANAMDVGNPSNFERFKAGLPDFAQGVYAISVDDKNIAAQITKDAFESGYVWCPHSATAAYAYEQFSHKEQQSPWVLVATAHPYKFRETVEPLIVGTLTPSPALAMIESLPVQMRDIAASSGALKAALRATL